MRGSKKHFGDARPSCARGSLRNALWLLAFLPVFANFTGCGSDDPVQPATTKTVDIAIAKSVDDSTPIEGSNVIYLVALSNAGPDSANAVEVTDVLPAGLTYVTANATQGSYDPGTGVWNVGGVANGDSAALALTVTVDHGTGGMTITNTATLTHVDGDNDGSNDTDTADVTALHALLVTPIKDNTLYQDAGGSVSNGVGEFMFSGRTNAAPGVALRRCVFAFDLSALPAGATIERVELTLNVSKAASNNPANFTMHRVLANWFEGTSNAGGRSPSNGGGGGAVSTTGDATWIHTAFPNSFWNNAGGDFRAFEAATVAVGDIGPYTWSGNGLRADVEFWRQNPTSNFGWMLIGNELAGQTAKRFDTRENTDGTGPQLVIGYALP